MLSSFTLWLDLPCSSSHFFMTSINLLSIVVWDFTVKDATVSLISEEHLGCIFILAWKGRGGGKRKAS